MIPTTYVAASEIYITLQNSAELILAIGEKEFCHLDFPLFILSPLYLLCCKGRLEKQLLL